MKQVFSGGKNLWNKTVENPPSIVVKYENMNWNDNATVDWKSFPMLNISTLNLNVCGLVLVITIKMIIALQMKLVVKHWN